MIVQSFILGNRVSLCMKIINSVVVVGLYYGFMTTFSIGPSYLFLLRARVMEEGEEGTEKKVSATTGFIAGQLMMFISIYYAPLHLALGRPHTITVLALPYLLFHFFWNNPKHFFDYGSTTRRNLSIQCVFLNNLIFQLFNHLILTSSMLARLVNIYMFRCNNKMLFVTSSFVGWLIGHILFMKWVGLVLVWIQQKNSSRSNVLIRFNKYLVSELRNSMARIFSILLFITCIYYLGRIPSPIFTKKLKVKETSETEERDVEIETTFERRGTKQEQEVSAEEDPSPSLFSEEKEDTDKIEETEEIRVNGKEKKKTKHEFHFRFKETCEKNSPVYESSYLHGNQEKAKFEIFQLLKEKEEKFILCFEKPVVTLLFDYKRWTRPVRYKKNNKFENDVQNEMSHYFFYTCRSDGKERISFTYPASLSTFLEMITKKFAFFTTENPSSHEFYTHWNYTNDQKRKNLTRELRNRIEDLDKGSLILDILEKRTQLYNDKTQKKNLPKKYDPLLHGPYRGRLKKKILPVILNKTYIKNKTGMLWINKIHNIILFNDYDKFDQTIDRVNRKPFAREEVGSLFTEHEQEQIDSEERKKILNFLFDAIITDPNDQKFRKKSIKEISKRVPRRSYKLIDNLDQELREYDENVRGEHAFRSRKAKRLVVSVDHQTKEDVTLPHYLEQSDFRRYIIKGSMRAQRRKTVIWKPIQANVHSPLFLNRIKKPFYLSFDISGLMKVIFRNWMWKNNDHKFADYANEKPRKLDKKKKKKTKKERYTRQEKVRIKQAEGWDKRFLTRVLRSSMLVIQSILRKYIILPSLILAKNLGRILLFQDPEWSEDFKDWRREIYVKCTYSGVNLSETEFPKNWLTEGIQIKILFPFRLKPWHRSKIQTSQKDAKSEEEADFCFLTALGLETEMPFGSPRKRRSFFEPIFKELKKNILKNKFFIVLRVFKEGKIKELSKINLREIDELGETQKNSILSNQKIHESSIEIPSMDWPNFSRTEKKMKDLTNRTSRIRNQIYKITKANKKGSLTQEINISSNKQTYSAKILDSSKKIWQIFKKRNTRLTRKSYFFVKFFIEKLYRKIFLVTLTIPRIHAKSFRESTRKKIKIIEKNIHNNEETTEIINKTNKNRIHFISTVKKSLLKISNKNSKISRNLSSFSKSQSQAYVFYKLLQAPIFNFYNLRPILQYHGRSLFLKNEIKDSFDKHVIFNYQLRHKTLWHFGRNLWKNWLSDHYQYDFSRIKWARLVPQEWRNIAHQHCMAQNKDFTKRDSYEKNGLTHCEKQHFFEADSLRNQKSNFKKHYRYYLLSYKEINYEDKKDSYIDRSLGQVNNKEEFYYTYNIKNNRKKANLFAMLGGIPINNYLGEDDIMDMDKFLYRKYFDWRILHFYLRNKVNIEAWVYMDTGTNSNQNTKIGSDNYKKIDAINKRGPFYLTIHQDEEINPSNKKKTLFDWMGMNEEILSCPISNLEPWFFPEFALLFNAYITKPWIIPIKLLLFNFNGNGKKTLTGKKEADLFISSTQKEYLELSNQSQEEKDQSQEEKELADQGNPGSDAQKKVSLGSVLSNHEKDVEENSTRSDMKKHIKKNKYKRETEVQLDFFLKKYLCLQLRWRGTVSFREKILNDMKVYCHLVRLINPSDVTIASIQGGEISLAILITKKDFALTELTKGGMFIIEPRRLSVKKDGQFFIYQIIGISLIHKITKRYHEKGYVYKKNFNEFIAKHQKITGNRNKNHYDLLVPENLFFPKRRRELTTLICFNSKNQNGMKRNPVFCTNVKSGGCFLDKNKDFSREKDQLIKLKFFIWTNSRLEDLICMNRYWFNTNNGSRFSMVRVHMYPRLKIR
uniref:Ycf1 n=1 Tax=Neoschmidia pallida TaxID=1226096 RepID=UPI00286A918D|nr:Ycf1 [Neoschmidia pallida]YP_010920006.1 Ycf1 [Neoschmidia pallida]WAJ52415.1 Ycf1 [Neoschmidia pallida]WAJ52416.1 Ycf1 [Neoschmidia pallida]